MDASMSALINKATRAAGLVLLVSLLASGCKERMQRPPPAEAERYWVPLSAMPLRGPSTAKATLVLFCDFQSPYCARAAALVQQLQREYGSNLRVQYRYNPLSTLYPQSQIAAEASAAAAEQGQFWRYHDLLFARQGALDRASLEQYARELGLDMERFRDALDSERARLKVDADAILASNLQARGAPVFYVNGRPLRGLVSLETFKKLIDEEVTLADSLLESGVAPSGLYQQIARAPVESTPEEQPVAPSPEPRGSTLQDPDPVYKVEVGESPSKGPKDAKVTIILWSDFECLRCGRFEAALNTLVAAYPKEVRVIWKFRPIADHPGAMLASEAALAAAQEGQFWQMHDLLFAEPNFERAKLEAHASRLGLDMARFRKALDERSYSEQVSRDLELSEKLVIRNLPTLFINGRRLEYGEGRLGEPSALLTLESLSARVQEEITRAEQLLKQGTPSAQLYESIIAHGVEGEGLKLSELPPLPRGVYPVEVGSSPVRGPKGAPITLITFSDFQCSYCKRLENTLAKVRAHYGDKVRIVWKDAPNTELHPEAMIAHEAARAAGEQGRFWEMQEKIFSRPYVLNRAAFEQYAAELGLDMERFLRALDTGKFQAAIREETAYGISLAGPSGTPTVFVNGRLMLGAYPFESFHQLIDEELARLPR
jgi:protein-disulfide isomerase